MNLVRSVMSVLMIVVVLLAIAGWIWAGGQPSPKAEGARACSGTLWADVAGMLGRPVVNQATANALNARKTMHSD